MQNFSLSDSAFLQETIFARISVLLILKHTKILALVISLIWTGTFYQLTHIKNAFKLCYDISQMLFFKVML